MKKIENIDNCLTYSYQDKNNEIITSKIANYAIQGLFVIKLIILQRYEKNGKNGTILYIF